MITHLSCTHWLAILTICDINHLKVNYSHGHIILLESAVTSISKSLYCSKYKHKHDELCYFQHTKYVQIFYMYRHTHTRAVAGTRQNRRLPSLIFGHNNPTFLWVLSYCYVPHMHSCVHSVIHGHTQLPMCIGLRVFRAQKHPCGQKLKPN